MTKKTTIIKKKIAIFIILVAIVCGISLIVMLINDYIPEPLKQVSHHEKVNLIKKIDKKFSVVVYYPDLDNNLNEIIVNEAKNIYKTIIDNKSELVENNSKVMILADYHMEDLSDTIAQLKFIASDKGSDSSYSMSKTIMIDKITGKQVDTANIFDDQALRLMRQNFRNMCKENDETNELAFSRAFLEKTAEDSTIFSNFYIEGTQLVFHIDMFDQQLVFRQNGEEIANHINLNLGISQTIDDPVIYIPTRYIDKDRPMIALTFDDGPHSEFTPQILEVLRKYDSAATFFIVGNRLGEKGKQVIFNEIESGSQVGSHSYSHPNMAKMKDLNEQFYLTSTKVYEEISQWCYQVELFRPPYGAIGKRMREESPYPFIMWNIDTLDWKTRDTQQTIDEILNNAKDGDFILMHDIHAESRDAAIEVIPMLIDKGFQLVTVSEMMEAKGIPMENGKSYYKGR